MTVRLVPFARARELLAERRTLDVVEGTSVAAAWALLLDTIPQLSEVRGVRFAVGGRLVDAQHVLREGDELAILPAVGGG